MLGSIDAEIIIVDNGSTDGTLEAITSIMPKAKTIVNGTNEGVAKARNQGIRAASGKYILILDNDTIANHAAIKAMMTHLDSHPWTGVVACKLIGIDGKAQCSLLPYPGLCIKIANILGIDTKEAVPHPDEEGVLHPDYLIGACQMIPKTLFEKIGLLDQNIFYGPEDADFCIRAHKAGYSIDYLPEYSIQHLHRRSTTHNIFSPLARKHIAALWHFYRKHHRWL